MQNMIFQNHDKLLEHIKEVSKNPNVYFSDQFITRVAGQWHEKQKYLKKLVGGMGLIETGFFIMDDDSAAIIMTLSGSIIKIGIKGDKGRKIEYMNFDVNHSKPAVTVYENINIMFDIIPYEPIVLYSSISNITLTTSPVYKICVCKKNIDSFKQDEILEKATSLLLESFSEINSTLQ